MGKSVTKNVLNARRSPDAGLEHQVPESVKISP